MFNGFIEYIRSDAKSAGHSSLIITKIMMLAFIQRNLHGRFFGQGDFPDQSELDGLTSLPHYIQDLLAGEALQVNSIQLFRKTETQKYTYIRQTDRWSSDWD